MARAKRPVTIAGIEFDALISEEHGYEATVPEYAVESGFSVSDAIIHGAETLNMVLYVTDTPVTWRSHSGRGRVEQVTKRLEELYYAADPRQLRQERCDRRFCRHGQHVQREQRTLRLRWLRFGFWLW